MKRAVLLLSLCASAALAGAAAREAEPTVAGQPAKVSPAPSPARPAPAAAPTAAQPTAAPAAVAPEPTPAASPEAGKINLGITPLRVDLGVRAGIETSQPIRITNSGEESVHLRGTVLDWTLTPS